jgi:hypothetical protein
MRFQRWFRCQAGQGTANMAFVGATIACLIWAMALLSGVDLKPGLSTVYQATEPLRQRAEELTGLLPL